LQHCPDPFQCITNRIGRDQGLQREEIPNRKFKRTDTRGHAVSGRSRLPFPRERRPGALSLLLNHLNYQLFTLQVSLFLNVQEVPPCVIQPWNVLSLRRFASALVLPNIVLLGLVEPSQSHDQGWGSRSRISSTVALSYSLVVSSSQELMAASPAFRSGPWCAATYTGVQARCDVPPSTYCVLARARNPNLLWRDRDVADPSVAIKQTVKGVPYSR
jgi:hypothetical protein